MIVIGRNGQLARAFASVLGGESTPATFVGRESIDLAHPDRIESALDAVLRCRPTEDPNRRTLVNTAAYTKVDLAESERELAYAANALAPEAMGRWATRRGYRFVHYSTDYVFPGDGEEPYQEGASISPLNYYGVTKAEGEARTLSEAPHAYVLRTSWVYGDGKNFPGTILARARSTGEVRVVDDQFGSPTYAVDLARATLRLLALIDREPNRGAHGGIFHCVNDGFTSWYGFAERVISEAQRRGQLPAGVRCVPVASSEFRTAAKRPRNSRMSSAKLRDVFGIEMRPWERALVDWFDDRVHFDPAVRTSV